MFKDILEIWECILLLYGFLFLLISPIFIIGLIIYILIIISN